MTNILFAAFEATPFFKSGGLGDVAGTLPSYIKGTHYDVRVILPKLPQIPGHFLGKMSFVEDFSVKLGWRNQLCGLYKMKYKGMEYYFLENDYYFNRPYPYGEFDEGERMAFFSMAILESISHMGDFVPRVLHCNDWHTALCPTFLKQFYKYKPVYSSLKTVFTIHNLKFQGAYSPAVLGDVLGLSEMDEGYNLLKDGAVNFMQGALKNCDIITTVSPCYADEICTEYYGEGFDWLFNERRKDLKGILNGIDYKIWNPEKDTHIVQNYNEANLKDKLKNKLALQKELGLKEDAGIPMFALVSRLTEQKGLDLLVYDLPAIADTDMQLVILGVGDEKYEQVFKEYANKYPEKISALLYFDDALSHRIYASADVLLMPSRFEPCGLSQMMSMKYGTLPLVRETGGLKDSVKPYNRFTGEGTGFSFYDYNGDVLMDTIRTAIKVYTKQHNAWTLMQKQAMNRDFSWRKSAKEYRKLYDSLVK